MIFLRTLKADIKRGIQSPLTWSAIVIMLLFTLLPLVNFAERLQTGSIAHVIELSISGDGISAITWSLLPTLGIPTALAADLGERADVFWITRCGQKRYVFSKFIASGLSGFFVQFIMFTVLEIVLSFQFPLLPNYLDDGFRLTVFVANTVTPVVGYFFVNIYLSLSGFWSGYMASAFSAFVPNRFAAVAFPTILYFLILRILSVPTYIQRMTLAEEMLDIKKISWNCFENTKNVYSAIGAKFIMVAVMCIIVGTAAAVYRERRLNNA